jgi:ElaA protein
MRHENNATTIGNDFVKGGDGCPHAGVVSNPKVFVEWHIVIHADDGFFARKIAVADGNHGIFGKSNHPLLMKEIPNLSELLYKSGTIHQLAATEVWDSMCLRQEVFILEQACLYPDMDKYDFEATHVLMYHKHGNLVGTARILKPGAKYTEASIGRIAINLNYRGLSLGRKLTADCIAKCQSMYPEAGIRISAQHRLENFYKSLSFVPVTEPYDEDGILHVDMVYSGAQ